MSDLGKWMFQKQLETVKAAIDARLPYLATANTSDPASGAVTLINPLTGAAENELAYSLGFRPSAGARVMVLTLADGSKLAVPLGSGGQLERDAALLINTDSVNALAVRTAAGASRVRVDTSNNELELWSGTDLVLYSNAGGTESARIDGATGLITGAFLAGRANRGVLLDTFYDAVPTTATNSSTSTYVSHGTASYALGPGVWTFIAVALGTYKNNASGCGAALRVSINGSAGAVVAETTATANNAIPIYALNERTGISGDSTVNLAADYRASAGGTASAKELVWLALAERTS